MNASQARVAALLSQAPIFGRLDEDLRRTCAAVFHETRFAKGRMIFARGDPGRHVYLVGAGLVRLAVATSEGRELSFQVAAEGAMFGEIAVLDGGQRSAEATALDDTLLYSLAGEDLRRLRQEHPA